MPSRLTWLIAFAGVWALPWSACSSGKGSSSVDSSAHDGADVSATDTGVASNDTAATDTAITPSDVGLSDANNASQIIPADRVIDWSPAGVIQPDGTRGIPNWTTICATINAATYGNGTTDASGAIQAAVNACPSGQVVSIPAGTYLLSNPVKISNSVVLRGAGPTTQIVESANIEFGVVPGSQPGTLYEANWTAGLTQGSQTITLDSVANLTVGQTIVLDQLNDTNVTTAGYVPLVNPVGNEGTVGVGVNDCASRDALNFCTDGSTAVPRALMQLAQVTAIAGNQVTLDRPVYYTHFASLSPQVFFWQGGNLKYAGIESVHIDAKFTAQAVDFSFCSHCWAKGIEVDHIARGAVSLWYADHNEVRDSYFFQAQASAPENYGVEVDDTGASLFENNIMDTLDVGVLVSWSSNGNVVAYNYSLNEDPGVSVLGTSHGTHSVHAFMNLFEGNVAGKLGFDFIWGSASHQTLFRNRLTGYMPPVASGGTLWSNGNWPLFMEAWNRYYNVVGNVLGTTGVPNAYQAATEADGALVGATGHTASCANPNCGLGVAPVYVLGFWNSWNVNDGPYDPYVASTLFRWGNYDYFSLATKWDVTELPPGAPTPPQTLPASFFHSAKPAWFGSAAWPPIGPDVTGYATPIPAQLCYTSSNIATGGTFNPATCY